MIDLDGRGVLPGLIDSHLHLIRGGLNYNLELRWDGVPSAWPTPCACSGAGRRTPPPQWVRVVGGWTEFQFAERRMPTLDEINAARARHARVRPAPVRPGAAERAPRCGPSATPRTRRTRPAARSSATTRGNPTGLLIARPNAMILYATLAKGPKLPPDDQENSTRQFMRELNRLGVTGAIDAGGGFQNYPDDYQVIEDLHRAGRDDRPRRLQPVHPEARRQEMRRLREAGSG